MKHQIPAGRHQRAHCHAADQLVKAAEMVLMQMGQDQKIHGLDPPVLQKLQQRRPPLAGELSAVHHHCFSSLLCIQQQDTAVRAAHI